VSTNGSGAFTATIAPDGDVIQYTEKYGGLRGTVTQSHIHVGQLGVRLVPDADVDLRNPKGRSG